MNSEPIFNNMTADKTKNLDRGCEYFTLECLETLFLFGRRRHNKKIIHECFHS